MMRGMDEQVLLKYDGPALEEHRMDVRDLAPALMGLADAMQAAGKLADPDVQVRLDIKANNEGSFEIEMLLNAVQNAGLFFAGAAATMVANGITIGGAISRAVLGAIAIASRVAQHGGKPKKVADLPDGTTVRIEYPNGTTFEAGNMDWVIFENGRAMAGIEKVVEPLKAGQIDSLTVRADGEEATVLESEREGFSSRFREEVLSDNDARMVLEVIEPNFREGTWRVSDGTTTYSVDIEDADFLARVESGEVRFGNGDSLIATVQVIQRRVNVNLRTDRIVTKVHDVLQPPSEPEAFDLES